MKKYLAILLAAALLLGAAPLAGFAAADWPGRDGSAFSVPARAAEIVASGDCGEADETNGPDGRQVKWTLDSDGLLTITGSGRMNDYSPGYRSGDYQTTAPWGGQQTKNVVIEKGVTYIGDYAFYRCADLSGISISDGVTGIGSLAFYDCAGLTEITLPDGVTTIGSSAFHGCKNLTTITLPDSVKSIGDYAFYSCDKLTDITIPDSVTSFGTHAFEDTAWYDGQPDGLVYAGKVAYKYKGAMPDNTSIVLAEDTKGISDSAFYDCAGLAGVTIPKGVTNIGQSAFSGCTGLTEITIPDGVTSIESGTFSGCASLKRVTIPDSVTSVGDNAFEETAWYNDQPDGLVYVGKVAFRYKGAMPDRTSIVLKDGAKAIAGSAFYQCENLTGITLPDSVTSIGSSAFSGCTGLTEISLPDSVTSIGGFAFSGCVGLTEITIPDGVTNIYGVFSACRGLTEITLPDTVTSIMYAFCDCSSLASFTVPANVKRFDGSDFAGCEALTELSVSEKNPVYISAGNCVIQKEEKELTLGCKTSRIPADGSVTSIGPGAFTRCAGLTEIAIPGGVTVIGAFAFDRCTGLTEVSIPEGVTAIGHHAFYGCTGLTEIAIPEGVTAIEYQTFGDCTGLTEITLPDSVTEIGQHAFWNCSRLAGVTIPAGVTEFNRHAFIGCTGLTELSVSEKNPVYYSKGNCVIQKEEKALVFGCKNSLIPADGSVTSIADGAFSGCAGLTEIAVPDSVTTIGSSAFNGCTGLTEIAIPDSVTAIGMSAFEGCSGLSKVTVGNGVTSVSSYLFKDCTGLTEVILPESITSIQSDAFDACAGLSGLILPAGVQEIEHDPIPDSAVIYGHDGSYVQQWAKRYRHAFVAVGGANVTLQAAEAVNEPEVTACGFANPGTEVVCSVNDRDIVTVKAAASGRWSAVLPLDGAKDGDSFTVKASVAAAGETAEKTAEVTYRPDAVLFRELTMHHRSYSVTVKGDRSGVSFPNITYAPGAPLAFRIRVSNSDRVDRLWIVSDRDGESKQMELTCHGATGYWFTDGYFDETDRNYVPGVLTVTGTDKDGNGFDTGIAININFLTDPSGYAYEAVQSNKLEGVTAAVYYRDAEGRELLWNAEPADQINPVKTLADGAFAWVTPEGRWQARLTKAGYEEARSEWMDAPPERTNVYIPMVSQNAPEVAYCNVYADRAEIIFSQYMNIDSVNTDSVKFDGYTGKTAPVDETETAEDSGVFYARTFAFAPDKAFSGKVSVAVSGAKNYAGRTLSPSYSATLTVAAEPKDLTAAQEVSVACGKTAEIVVSAENAAGKTVTATCDSANVTLDPLTLTLDQNGKTTVLCEGKMPGTATLTFTLDGTALTVTADVTVTIPDGSDEPATPTDPDHPGPATPTDPDQPGPATPTDPDQPGPATPTDPDQPDPTKLYDIDEPGYSIGDVDGNGEISPGDARLALRASVWLEEYKPGSAPFRAADVDKNGAIEASDARIILRVCVQLESF